MKHILVNLKRFDILPEYGGVNRIAPVLEWGSYIVNHIQDALREYENQEVEFTIYFPEAHITGAVAALKEGSPLQVGCQGVHREDTSPGGNFGTFTTNRTANSVLGLGCNSVIIGHYEERRDKADILAEARADDNDAVNRILNQEVQTAVQAGLSVLYCIGEKAEEQEQWQKVLKQQLEIGLKDVDTSNVTIAYEPVWAIGPGKIPPGREYIEMVGRYVKEVTGGLDVVYGGGLKADNAAMIASIPEIDGGLIALTRFQGEIGFYPEEYLEIIRIYMEGNL